MKKVIIYSSSTCPYCEEAKEYLSSKQVSYEERNIKESNYRKELMSLGFMSVPVIKIEEDVVLGFDKERINNLLGL